MLWTKSTPTSTISTTITTKTTTKTSHLYIATISDTTDTYMAEHFCRKIAQMS